MARTYDQLCPIARTLDLIGDRWTLLIIRDLFFGVTKFNDFLQRSPAMPTKILSDRLRALEAAGIVERAPYSTRPPRAAYGLTAKGRSLEPVLEAIVDWGMRHTIDARQRPAVRRKITSRLRRARMANPARPDRTGASPAGARRKTR